MALLEKLHRHEDAIARSTAITVRYTNDRMDMFQEALSVTAMNVYELTNSDKARGWMSLPHRGDLNRQLRRASAGLVRIQDSPRSTTQVVYSDNPATYLIVQSSQLKFVIVDWPKGISIVIETRASIAEAMGTRILPRRSSMIDPTQNRRTQPCCRIMTTSPRICWRMRQRLQTPNHGLGPRPVLCQILQLGIPVCSTNPSLLARCRCPANPERWPNPHSTRRNAGTGCL
jgi:hypothetical protein